MTYLELHDNENRALAAFMQEQLIGYRKTALAAGIKGD